MGEYFNENLKEAREKRGMTQKEVAKKLHISRSYVSRIEKKALMLLKSKIKT